MDLLDGLAKIERKGEKLVLWVDEKRRHQLRAVASPKPHGLRAGSETSCGAF